MKIALVHDVLNQLGGAEKVLENFLEIWPDGVLHTVFYDEGKTEGRFARFAKRISFLNRMPLAHRHPRLFLAAFPFAFGRFRFDDFDVVLSDSSAFAKGAKSRGKLHVCYCHTPTRFLWIEREYIDKQRYPWVLKFLGKLAMPFLRRWDYKAAQGPHFMLANSKNVQERIRKYYHRESEVIYPPADTEFFRPTGAKQDYFFTASRLEPYKRIDLVIQAFNRLGWPLKVAGNGTDIDRLRSLAGPNIEFLGRIPDEELRRRYSEAKAFIFPAEEDAGIMVVEAQACGTPVIAYGKGGSLETVIPGVTGELFLQQAEESLLAVLRAFNPASYSPEAIRAQAQKFNKAAFQERIRDFVERRYREFGAAGKAQP
jgi:glycosyltransferase involved in cell wall biosynthesis